MFSIVRIKGTLLFAEIILALCLRVRYNLGRLFQKVLNMRDVLIK